MLQNIRIMIKQPSKEKNGERNMGAKMYGSKCVGGNRVYIKDTNK